MGMEQTGLAGLAGGSDDMVVFQAELADRDQAGMDTAAAGVSVRWSPMDRGLVLLLAVWAMYAASFFVP